MNTKVNKIMFMSIESPFPGREGREPQHYSFVDKKERRSNGSIPDIQPA